MLNAERILHLKSLVTTTGWRRRKRHVEKDSGWWWLVVVVSDKDAGAKPTSAIGYSPGGAYAERREGNMIRRVCRFNACCFHLTHHHNETWTKLAPWLAVTKN